MRVRIIERVIWVLMALLWAALFVTQVAHGPEYRDKAERNRTRLIPLPAARGSILDRNGVPIAEDHIRFELTVLPQELRDPQKTWTALSQALGIPEQELIRRYKKRFQARFSPVTIMEDLRPEAAFHFEEEREKFPAVLIRPVPERVYPSGAASGSVTGYLGLITVNELTRLKPYGYSFRDRVGKDGLEQQYDALLRGTDGGLYVEVNAQGKIAQQMGFKSPERGKSIGVSVDSRLQELIYRLLEGERAAVAVMNCSSGEILALVSSPSFDPSVFVDAARDDEINTVLRGEDQPMFNRVIRALVPPGSTFKAAVAYEALAENKIAASTAFECTGKLQLGNAVFRCWQSSGHGPQTVADALEHSCNFFFYQTGRRLGSDGVARAAHLFRLGQATGIDLPREAKGFVPDPAWLRRTQGHAWREGDTLSFAIGQGALLTTPLQMLALFNALAMGGLWPQPHLVKTVDGRSVEIPRPISLGLQASDLDKMKIGLARVVSSDTGTGRLARVPGLEIAAKTGTAQAATGASHAWICGYAPARNPKISFVVFVEHGGKGGVRAAKVAGQMMVYLREMGYV